MPATRVYLATSPNLQDRASPPSPSASGAVSPTVFRERGYRFFFFSREEERMHVHVSCADGEAKFWLEPSIALAHSHGLSQPQLARIRSIVEAHEYELIHAWQEHFGR